MRQKVSRPRASLARASCPSRTPGGMIFNEIVCIVSCPLPQSFFVCLQSVRFLSRSLTGVDACTHTLDDRKTPLFRNGMLRRGSQRQFEGSTQNYARKTGKSKPFCFSTGGRTGGFNYSMELCSGLWETVDVFGQRKSVGIVMQVTQTLRKTWREGSHTASDKFRHERHDI